MSTVIAVNYALHYQQARHNIEHAWNVLTMRVMRK